MLCYLFEDINDSFLFVFLSFFFESLHSLFLPSCYFPICSFLSLYLMLEAFLRSLVILGRTLIFKNDALRVDLNL